MIKVGYLVSYDYSYLMVSLKQVYPYVKKIYLAFDKQQKTWSGQKIAIPNSFYKEIEEFDRQNKIKLYFDDFYVPGLTPAECETRERNLLLKEMGRGWLMQLDVDEYLYDFRELSSYLNKYWYLTIFPSLTPIHFRGKWVTLFKKLPNGFLFVDNKETFPFITNQKKFSKNRSNERVRNHLTNFCAIHQSWAREEDEMLMKIKNWGHRDDFNTLSYLNWWKGLNENNYKDSKNFHPLIPGIWKQLLFIAAIDEEEFITTYSSRNRQEPILLDLKEWIKYWIKRIFKKCQ